MRDRASRLDQYALMEAYREECFSLIERVRVLLPEGSTDLAKHLVEVNEAPEAMVYLAWAITNSKRTVPAADIAQLLGLGEGFEQEEFYPPGFGQ